VIQVASLLWEWQWPKEVDGEMHVEKPGAFIEEKKK
jgi:hypothetical protein